MYSDVMNAVIVNAMKEDEELQRNHPQRVQGRSRSSDIADKRESGHMDRATSSTTAVNRRFQALRVKVKRKKKNKGQLNPASTKKVAAKQSRSSSSSRSYSSSSSDAWESESQVSSKESDVADADSNSNDAEEEEEDEEDQEDYQVGGYHPVKIGDVYNQRYEIIRKLGWGHFSTVWLCHDRFNRRYVALKVVKSEEKYTETANDEIKLLRKVMNADVNDPNRDKVVHLLDEFKVCGIHGMHVCMVMEVLGFNLLKLITGSNYSGIPLPNLKIILRQILEALDYLHHKCRIIHTDIKPENILLCADEEHVKSLHQEAIMWDRTGIPYPTHAVCNLPEDVRSKVYPSANPVVESAPDGAMTRNKKKKLKAKAKKMQQKQQQLELANNNNNENNSIQLEEEAGPKPKLLTDNEEGAAGDSNTKKLDLKAQELFKPYKLHPDPSKEVCENIKIKIADLGNACYIDHHFSDDIQTRQYRSLEVIIGAGYGPQSDIWSVACMAFELAVGDYLFQPHTGENYSRDEDHCAHIIELLGPIPRRIALSGKYSHDIFNRKGKLRNISDLKPWSLDRVLIEKYDWNEEQAMEFADFLNPMLAYDWTSRATAAKCLSHPFLS
ncbi:Serine/threonine-protein kinase spk-1 [Orchesella cincta]|uniref:non-specific serine/threonine protein kinase n=1 Tax=Orchesella cincta TaxID=48709 RepID=A0A1D2MG26_ORCCI|nr:Serine/threonine-protein kinase spk-1 [Orchesella cincta]